MPRPSVALAVDTDRWIPTEGDGMRFTELGRDMWLERVSAEVAASLGVQDLPEPIARALSALEPSPVGVSRYLYLPSGHAALGIVTVQAARLTPTWREEFDEALSHPVGLVRDVELAPLEMESSDEAVSAMRVEETNGSVMATVTCAVPRGEALIVLRGTSADVVTVLAIRGEAEHVLDTAEVVGG